MVDEKRVVRIIKNRHLSPKKLDSEEVGTGESRLDQGSILKFSVCF